MKAFDKVSHRRLIQKIRSYGITGNILNWITDFLQRTTDIWNSLKPQSVVDALTLKSFEKRLDKYWIHHPILWDYTAKLLTAGTGQESELENIKELASEAEDSA